MINEGDLKGEVIEKSFVGGLSKVTFKLDDGQEIISSHSGMDVPVQVGDIINIGWSSLSQVEVIDNEN